MIECILEMDGELCYMLSKRFRLIDIAKLTGDTEVDKALTDKTCSICNGKFIGRNEKDNAIVSGKQPLTFAHESCWGNNE